jgi:hypothetical protein
MVNSQNVRLSSENLTNYFNKTYSNVKSTRPDVDVSELIASDILGDDNTYYFDMVDTINFLLSYDKSKDLFTQFNEYIECDLFSEKTFNYSVDKILTFKF